MTGRVKVGSRNQIVIPVKMREELGIGPGDHLLVSLQDGVLFMMPEPEDILAHMRGLGKEIWAGVDAVEYVRAERGA